MIEVSPAGWMRCSCRLTAERSDVSAICGVTRLLKVVSAARSSGFSPSSSAWLAATRSFCRCPWVLSLVSRARIALIGMSEVSTTSTVWTTPLSRSSKSEAVRPATGVRPSVTRTSTRTPSVRDEKVCL
jgi:hypothetical protein